MHTPSSVLVVSPSSLRLVMAVYLVCRIETALPSSQSSRQVAPSEHPYCLTVLFDPDVHTSITSVGGTDGESPETGVSFSGGGFSNYFARPDYQSDVVPAYLSFLGDTYSGLYNASGRGFPDVSAQANNYQIVNDGSTTGVAGTSCSSPLFASIVSLLNDELIAAGKSPLGFLNPWLYSTAASAFTDITSGNNPGCNTDGFSATTGWDPVCSTSCFMELITDRPQVTGLGTPVYSKLQAAAGL